MLTRITKDTFPEKLSPFLKKKIDLTLQRQGKDSTDYQGLYRQYIKTGAEASKTREHNTKHYEAGMDIEFQGARLKGLERLYHRSLVIEPTLICAAHCRHCLRANYDMFTLKEHECKRIAQYCGSDDLKHDLKEVLITGGDPLLITQKLKYLIEMMYEYAPHVKIFRVATRLLTQSPDRIDNNVFEIFKNKPDDVRFELATQINHPVEFFPETVEKIRHLRSLGVKIYSQNVLLKGVNDRIETLIALYNKMRELDIEAHYLFHCVPILGTHHMRTRVEKGLWLIRELTNSGAVSGRAKPMYALMTDIGKITLHHGTILKKNEQNHILLQSNYKYDERVKWNPNWKLPENAEVDENGYLRVWYMDGTED
ncbi:MAG: hypothetical protein GY737_22870 [Desulfobacteraceae bacterium]|nr:hypothetical protein [Desulfobacteraceae bacterium]